jgi:ribosomal protein L28
MKLGHLFHTLSPAQALRLERKNKFFTLPISCLKEKLIELDPKMEGYFDQFLSAMKLEEIFPGRRRFKVNGLVEKMTEDGRPIHLTRSMSGISDIQGACDHLHRLLKVGLYSVEVRDTANFHHRGYVSTDDGDLRGVNDAIFTQMVTTETDYDQMGYSSIPYRLVVSPETLEYGSY